MADQNPTDEVISKLNFTGGFPDKTDLAPSIIFLVVYAASVPLLVWRIVKKQHRTIILFRPTLFVMCRLGMLGLRAFMANNPTDYGISVLVAQLVMVSIGYLFLCDSLISLWKRNVEAVIPIDEAPGWVQRLARILRLLLLAAIATILASSIMSAGMYNGSGPPPESEISQVTTLRHASYCLSLAVPVVLLFTLVLTQRFFDLPKRKTYYIALPALALIVVAAYRVAQTFSKSASDPARTKAAFWVLQMFFELVAYALFLAISIPTMYPLAPKNRQPDHEAMREEDKSTTYDNRPNLPHLDSGRRELYGGGAGYGNNRDQWGGSGGRGGLIRGVLGQSLKMLDH